jgi:hypothetical protein
LRKIILIVCLANNPNIAITISMQIGIANMKNRYDLMRGFDLEVERDLSAVRSPILGIKRILGSRYSVDLTAVDGFAARGCESKTLLAALPHFTHDELVEACERERVDRCRDRSAVGGS